MRLPAPTALPKSAIPWSYHYTESESEANFINTNGGDSTQPSELGKLIEEKESKIYILCYLNQKICLSFQDFENVLAPSGHSKDILAQGAQFVKSG